MISLADIGDRHSRAVAGLNMGGETLVVRIVADCLDTPASQHLLTCLVNLLCRMAGSVAAIELDVPQTRMSVVMPHGISNATAFDAMAELAEWAVGNHIPVVRDAGPGQRLALCIGRTEQARGDIYVHGHGWIAWVGSDVPVVTSQLADPNPIGPYFAACLAAGEVFKRARGLVRGRFARDEGFSLWNGGSGSLAQLRDGPSLAGCSVPPFFLVGAGAVGQGLFAVLAASGVSTFVVTIDDDCHDSTNLNRCFLAGIADVGHEKVEVIARARKASGVGGTEYRGTLREFVRNGPLATMPVALQDAHESDQFHTVISAVDRNTSRWDIQGLQPRVAIGGSTDGLTAKVMSFEKHDGRPCLACNNAREEDGAKLRALEQRIRDLAPEAARIHLRECGSTDDEIDAVLAFVRDAPGCGTAGERILGALASASPREFSVSFVSLAAAVLTFARLLASSNPDWIPAERPVMTSVSFRNLTMADDSIAQDPTCPYCQVHNGSGVDGGSRIICNI